jgi:hypothetical protein
MTLPLLRSTLAAAACGLSLAASAAPYTPTNDAQVLERVVARVGDARGRELEALRAAWRREPRTPAAALAFARRAFDEALAQGDPRFVGQAQAALAPWWSERAPAPEVRVQRARILQYGHQFAAALADLDAVLAVDASHLDARAQRAAIRMVRADYAGARGDCEALAPLASALISTACVAFADSMNGRIDAAARALAAALDAAPGAPAAERLWAWTRLAEIEERRGDMALAERAFRAALALGEPDVYLLAAYADFLLDQGRAAEALAALVAARAGAPDAARADVLLLRLALAAQATKDPRGAAWTRELAARFDAARARGDDSHEKEESRFALALQGDAARALTLAKANFEVQREAADARALIEAALAAKDAAAAAPALRWMRDHGVQGVALQRLARQLEAAR